MITCSTLPTAATFVRRALTRKPFLILQSLNVAAAEKVDSFEIGSKNKFAHRVVTLNMAAFYYKYRNQQFINIDPATRGPKLC